MREILYIATGFSLFLFIYHFVMPWIKRKISFIYMLILSYKVKKILRKTKSEEANKLANDLTEAIKKELIK